MQLKYICLVVLTLILLQSCHEISNELCTTDQTYKTEYSEFEGLDVYNNMDDAIDCSVITQKPLFVIFSSYGYGKETSAQKILKSKRIRRMVSEKFIPAVLYVDDKSKLDEIQVVKRNGEEQLLRTIGNLNTDYQVQKFNNNSQPFLAILDPTGEIVIAEMSYAESQTTYYSLLKNGYNKYHSSKEATTE